MSTLSSADTTSRPVAATRSPHSPRSMRWSELVEVVRESGQYATEAETEGVIRIVLSALGGHVTGDVRDELARRLPEEAARLLATQLPATRQLTAAQFVESVGRPHPGRDPGDSPLGRHISPQRPPEHRGRRSNRPSPGSTLPGLRPVVRQGGPDTGGVTPQRLHERWRRSWPDHPSRP
jgi:hypothetical protein